MTRRVLAAAAVATCVAASACRQADAARTARIDSTLLAKRESRLEAALAQRDSAGADTTIKGKVLARWIMPKALDELSGIALEDSGRVLAEEDENGRIFEIDYRRGVITKQFRIGSPTIKADLEAIAIVNGEVYALASNGTLYEFREGANNEHVDYTSHDTRLGKECEFEGLAYDSTLGSLLLACKHVHEKKLKGNIVIYRWKLSAGGDRLSHMTVPLKKVLPGIGEKDFHPSDITIDPFTGNYILIAGIEQAIVSITPSGDVVFARRLPGGHDQPESVAITRDSLLIIGDEAQRRPAVITVYPWP
jgi:uncharacterized protein YjiK